jgi:hypothetical protein
MFCVGGCIVIHAVVCVISVIRILQAEPGIAVMSVYVKSKEIGTSVCTPGICTSYTFVSIYFPCLHSVHLYIVHHYILTHPTLCGCPGQGAYVARKIPHKSEQYLDREPAKERALLEKLS